MTKKEANAFRKTLESREKELQNANKTQPIAMEATSDELDRIQQATERDYAIGSLERNFSRLREVSAAIRRIDAGTFGVCSSCEEEITPKRLAAVPWAALCIGCQETADRERLEPSSEMEESLSAAS
jgi:DnaK suppressor protein